MFEYCVVIFKRLIKSDNPSKATAALTDQDAELGNSAGRIVTCSIDDEEEQDKEEDEEEVKAPRCRVVGVAQVLSVQWRKNHWHICQQTNKLLDVVNNMGGNVIYHVNVHFSKMTAIIWHWSHGKCTHTYRKKYSPGWKSDFHLGFDFFFFFIHSEAQNTPSLAVSVIYVCGLFWRKAIYRFQIDKKALWDKLDSPAWINTLTLSVCLNTVELISTIPRTMI